MHVLPIGDSIVYAKQPLRHESLALLFIAGAGGSAATWPESLLQATQAQALTIDLPGHGAAPKPGRRSIAHYAQEISACLNALELEHVVLVGHSMGAAIALAVAAERLPAVRGLVLLGAAIQLKVAPVLFASLATDFPAAARFVTRYGYAQASESDLAEACVGEILTCGEVVTTGDFLACDRYNAQLDLPQIEVPVLVVAGSEDKLVRPAASAALASALQAGSLAIIEGAGHFTMQEEPDRVAQLLNGFISDLR